MPANTEAQFKEAVNHLMAGRHRDAMASAEQLVRRNPRDGRAQSLLGAVYLNQGLYAEALQAAFPPEVPEFGDDMPEAQVVSLSDWVGAAETAEPDVAVPVIPAPDMPAPEPVTAEALPPASPIAL